MTIRFDAPYLKWATLRAPARLDLAGSAVSACTIDDLEGARDAIELTGDNTGAFPPLVAALSTRYGWPEAGITTTHGTSGANFLVCAALLAPGDEVIVERPGYDALLGAAQIFGARTIRFDRAFENGFALDPDRVRRAVTARTRLVVVTSPQNPTGVVAAPDALEEVGRIAATNGVHVLVDEVYLDAVASRATEGASVIRTAAAGGDVFISTSSLTKSYGLTGLRCGWILSSPALAERLQTVRRIVDVAGSIVTDRLAALAFSQIDRLTARGRALLDANHALARAFLRTRPELEWIAPGPGTLVFPRIRGVDDADTFARRLLEERETAVVPGRFFDAPAHFRIGLGGPSQVVRLGLEAIGAALDAAAW
ncbi:MAG: hypothetical protein V7647_3738 [Acidobacteriota bacterium]|jgi:aspartate/methionine/tyrosine aminotransferase